MAEASLLDILNKVVAGQLSLSTTPSSGAPSNLTSITDVEASTASVELLPDNSSRRGVILYNDSSYYAYVSFGSTVSLSVWSIKIGPSQAYENTVTQYTGPITAIWSGGLGSMKITEFI